MVILLSNFLPAIMALPIHFQRLFFYSAQCSKEKKKEIDRLWKLLLLNQFHDVIPGTSIGAVFDDSRKHYEDISASVAKMTAQHWAVVTAITGGHGNPGHLVFNPNPFPFSGFVNVGATRAQVTVPPLGIHYVDQAAEKAQLPAEEHVKGNPGLPLSLPPSLSQYLLACSGRRERWI